MSSITVYAVVEGKTEKIFIQNILAPYLSTKNIVMIPMEISKPGQKGGDVKFSRAKNDFEKLLKQRSDTYITTFIDFYGIKEWPGKDIDGMLTSGEKAFHINKNTHDKVNKLFGEYNSSTRFIPYIAIHEFEAMLFSDSEILAKKLDVEKIRIDNIIIECGEPEKINDSPQTAPSKRLDKLISGKFKKTTDGISIAQEIGINKIRAKCPIFNKWLTIIENLPPL